MRDIFIVLCFYVAPLALYVLSRWATKDKRDAIAEIEHHILMNELDKIQADYLREMGISHPLEDSTKRKNDHITTIDGEALEVVDSDN